jgi:hypothetical protein
VGLDIAYLLPLCARDEIHEREKLLGGVAGLSASVAVTCRPFRMKLSQFESFVGSGRTWVCCKVPPYNFSARHAQLDDRHI